MKESIEKAFAPFTDKCVIRVYEAVLLVIGTMAASIGLVMAFLFYGNDITTKFGWQPLVPFAVFSVDESVKVKSLILAGVGLAIYGIIMMVVTGKSRMVKK